jgi:hypothetical protein
MALYYPYHPDKGEGTEGVEDHARREQAAAKKVQDLAKKLESDAEALERAEADLDQIEQER